MPSPSGTCSTNPPSPPGSPASGPSIPSIKAFQNALWDTGSPEDFAETFATNVTAVYYTTIAFLDLLHQGNMRQHQNNIHDFISHPDLASNSSLPRPPCYSSQVLSISSSGSFRYDAKVLSPSYTLSKSACTHLGKLLANLLSPWGIRSNVLAPGVWPTGKCYSQRLTNLHSLTPDSFFCHFTFWLQIPHFSHHSIRHDHLPYSRLQALTIRFSRHSSTPPCGDPGGMLFLQGVTEAHLRTTTRFPSSEF